MKLLIAVLTTLLACENEDEVSALRIHLLTGGSQKTWHLHSATDETLCESVADDFCTFGSDGSFKYDQGTIDENEGENCWFKEDAIGTWKFVGDDSFLMVKLTNGNTFINGPIVDLSEEKLIIQRALGVFEFRTP